MKVTHSTFFIQKISLPILFLLLMNFSTLAQTKNANQLQDEFEQYKKNANKEFQQYKDERDKEFADLLKKRWTAFKTELSKEPVIVPKPPKQPDVLPPAPKQEDIKNIPSVILPTIISPKDNPIIVKVPKVEPLLLPLSTPISYFNLPLTIYFDSKMKSHCEEISEKGVSDYWNVLSSSNYPKFLEEINELGNQMQLNDWGYYELINSIANEITNDKNDQTLFCFFMLSHLKFDVKVAKRNSNLVLLIPFETTVYKKSFISINGRNYYVMNNDTEGAIYTFKQSFYDANKQFDLSVTKTLKLGNDYSSKDIYFKKYDKTIPVKFNKNLVRFYNAVPMSDLSIFFNAKLDPITENSLSKYLIPLIENKNELEAVNIILEFVQKSFEYKTDLAQFGYEKFYFPEDIFNYPYSDCEDRAVLFSHLVKALLNLEVVGLEYNTHAACAVKFNSPINGDAVIYKGEKYIICDPTYIGASAGMAMPQFLNEKPTIILTSKSK
jgi:hypothetical protein